MGFELKDCIAFGDGMNDAEMLSMAGKGWSGFAST
jgi:hydroxymethylpyrimidine pyrophosphatase-like HAD family hydrolase